MHSPINQEVKNIFACVSYKVKQSNGVFINILPQMRMNSCDKRPHDKNVIKSIHNNRRCISPDEDVVYLAVDKRSFFCRRKKLLNPNMTLERVNLWADKRKNKEFVTNGDAQLSDVNISKISNKINANLSPFNDKIINMLK